WLSHRGPDKADQFPRYRHDGHWRPLAMPDEMAVAAMQPLLRAPRMTDDVGGLVGRPPTQRARDGGPMAIVPGRLDEHAAGVAVAGLGDGAPSEYSSAETHTRGAITKTGNS